jgi:hypothetical protein
VDDTTMWIIKIFGGVILLLLGIIGYFIRQILERLNGMQTVEGCNAKTYGCKELRDAYHTGDEREKSQICNRLDSLIESFEHLSKCLQTYTKGECP